MRVVLNTDHLSVIGGGENYMMRLAMALDKVSDFSVVQNWPGNFQQYNGFGKQFRKYNGLFKPDVFIHSSHFRNSVPIGRINVAVVFFPKKELLPEGYDHFLAICGFSAEWVSRYWGHRAEIIYPAVDPDLFMSGRKKDRIVSIGHFFEEEDGHSKNQHILCEAFEDLEGWELVLIGNANPQDAKYLQKVKDAARGKNIRIETNKPDSFIKNTLSTSRVLWHANGYRRTEPHQTEHFGIIVLEALASGCIPIVHNSGGAREIVGITWDNPQELSDLTKRHTKVPKLPAYARIDVFNERVEKWLNSISGVDQTTGKAGATSTKATAKSTSRTTSKRPRTRSKTGSSST